MTTLKQAIAERKHLHPDELEKVMTVYNEIVYIPKDRKPGHMIPMYEKNGTPRVMRLQRGYYVPDMLHPENIYRPNMHPLPGDYLAITKAEGKPSENKTNIFMTRETVTEGVYLVETMESEMYTVTRYPELDTNSRRAWKQVAV